MAKATDDNVSPIRPLGEEEAIAWLRAQPGGRTNLSDAELGRRWGWNRKRVGRRLTAWANDGRISRRGNVTTAVPTPVPTELDGEGVPPRETEAGTGTSTEFVPPSVTPVVTPHADVQPPGRSLAIRKAALAAAAAPPTVVEKTVCTYAVSDVRPIVPHAPFEPPRKELPARPTWWAAIGRTMVGLAIVFTGAFIAFTSMRANSWFGHSLTPDPTAGEVYSHLSVAAEVIACLIPTATRFYWQDGDWWTALRGWALMAVALTVVFVAAGGVAVTNLTAGTEARAERDTQALRDLRVQIASLEKSIASECVKRGDRCRDLEAQRARASDRLAAERAAVTQDADPQAAAFGISPARLHVIQAGAMVALCLFSGLFISFGAGLIWRRPASGRAR